MSTKCTAANGKGFHLYEECFDKHSINLELENPLGLKMDFWGGSEGQVTVTIPIDTWRAIVKGWLQSHWGQRPELDHSDPVGDLDNLLYQTPMLHNTDNKEN